jgi:hypothetical protein
MDFPLPLPVRCKGGREAEVEARPPASKRRMAASGPQARDAPLTRWPTAMLDRRSQPYARQHRSGRRDGLFRSNKGMERSRIVDSPRVFHAHRLSGVGGRAPPNLVPLFAAHHMECSQLDWRSAIPLVSVEINIFLCTLDDENLSRNITYRDQFSRVSTSNTVLWLTLRPRLTRSWVLVSTKLCSPLGAFSSVWWHR